MFLTCNTLITPCKWVSHIAWQFNIRVSCNFFLKLLHLPLHCISVLLLDLLSTFFSLLLLSLTYLANTINDLSWFDDIAIWDFIQWDGLVSFLDRLIDLVRWLSDLSPSFDRRNLLHFALDPLPFVFTYLTCRSHAALNDLAFWKLIWLLHDRVELPPLLSVFLLPLVFWILF